jgi:predicted DNA-binding antitoxin AbrB/MazE fold protein
LSFEQAREEAGNIASNILKGLRSVRLRKQQEVEINIRNNPGLFEIESNLNEIRNLINDKIDQFRAHLARIYSQHIR